MKAVKILVVEDERAILMGLVDLLGVEGYEVLQAADGIEALRIYEHERPDLILLDIMIPGRSGYEVCREIRMTDPLVPILMLTAKGQEVDKVVGLGQGADDYIVKPFGIGELLARVKAALRRSCASSQKPCGPIIFGRVQIDPRTLKGTRGDEEFDVIPREVQLLRYFMAHDGEVIDRLTLLDEIWGTGYEGTTRTLDQHIVKLRRKIEDDPANPRHITTAHGVGYRFSSSPS
jgi:DNA-binding response OmpR family regulator